MTKAKRHQAIRARASRALANLYHNATPTYPTLETDDDCERFNAWFEEAAIYEVAHLNAGGAYGSDYARTLAASCNAGRYASERARRYYIAKGLRSMRLDRATTRGGLAERITEFGKLYTWGRGGRTLAPDGLIRTRGGSSFAIRQDYADDLPLADVVELVRIVEAFNAHVEAWNRELPAEYRYQTEADAEEASGILEFTD